MEGLCQEARENNIRSTMISPGAVDTGLYNTINDPKAQAMLRKVHRQKAMVSPQAMLLTQWHMPLVHLEQFL